MLRRSGRAWIVLVLLSLSCSGKPTCPRSGDITFPLADGNSWTYVLSGSGSLDGGTTRIAGSVVFEGERYWDLENGFDREHLLLRQDGPILYAVLPGDTVGGSPLQDSLRNTFPWRFADFSERAFQGARVIFAFTEVDTECTSGAETGYRLMNGGRVDRRFRGCDLSVQWIRLQMSRASVCPAAYYHLTIDFYIADAIGVIERDESYEVFVDGWRNEGASLWNLQSWNLH